MNVSIPCTFKLSDDGVSNIPGTILAFVPRSSPLVFKPCNYGRNKLEVEYTVDALIQLKSFDLGSIYQVPLTRVKIVQV